MPQTTAAAAGKLFSIQQTTAQKATRRGCPPSTIACTKLLRKPDVRYRNHRNQSASSRTLLVNHLRPVLLVLRLRQPHLVEASKRSKYRAPQPRANPAHVKNGNQCVSRRSDRRSGQTSMSTRSSNGIDRDEGPPPRPSATYPALIVPTHKLRDGVTIDRPLNQSMRTTQRHQGTHKSSSTIN